MKWTVIGYWGGYPAPGSATSAYLLEHEGFKLLIDAGSGALSRLQTRCQIADLDAVIISHYHHDHVADIGVLQYAKLVESYLTKHTKRLPIYGHDGDEDKFRELSHHMTDGVVYHPDQELDIGPFQITFLKTAHPVVCYGMRIATDEAIIVYTADTAFQESWIPFARGADLFVTDCNFYAHQNGFDAGHMTSAEGGYIAHEAGVGTLLLSHLPQYGSHDQLAEEAAAYFDGPIHIATEGLIWQG